MKTLDVRNLACPGPVLKLRDLLSAGETSVIMHVADELARSNVSRFAASRHAEVKVETSSDGGFLLTVTAGEGSAAPQPGEQALLDCELPTTGATVVQITGTTMGTGDDELGELLMRSFLKTQAQLEEPPAAIIFYNQSVTLCCKGSELLDDLRQLEASGIEIIACGTCLNFFGLSDHLEVGRVTDMLEIATRLATAARVVRP
jgi:selenium metabolism protein YedF